MSDHSQGSKKLFKDGRNTKAALFERLLQSLIILQRKNQNRKQKRPITWAMTNFHLRSTGNVRQQKDWRLVYRNQTARLFLRQERYKRGHTLYSWYSPNTSKIKIMLMMKISLSWWVVCSVCSRISSTNPSITSKSRCINSKTKCSIPSAKSRRSSNKVKIRNKNHELYSDSGQHLLVGLIRASTAQSAVSQLRE